MTDQLTEVDIVSTKEMVKQLRDNAAVLLAPGTAIPAGAIAGALQMAADEIERLREDADRWLAYLKYYDREEMVAAEWDGPAAITTFIDGMRLAEAP